MFLNLLQTRFVPKPLTQLRLHFWSCVSRVWSQRVNARLNRVCVCIYVLCALVSFCRSFTHTAGPGTPGLRLTDHRMYSLVGPWVVTDV